MSDSQLCDGMGPRNNGVLSKKEWVIDQLYEENEEVYICRI